MMAQADMDRFLANIQSSDLDVRQRAWQSAGPMGAQAILPLGRLAASSDKGVARAATFALQKIAHYAARPGSKERQAVIAELLKLAMGSYPRTVRAEALTLLGFVGDSQTVPNLVKIMLSDEAVREEARMALERIPGKETLNALKAALRIAPEDFKPNIEQSIQNRALTPQTVGIRAAQKG